MAKVGERAGGTAAEALAQLKDQYQMREHEMENRHRDEVLDIKATHHAEIEKIEEDDKKRLVAVQEENAVKLNAKDMQFQKEIEAVRAMYQKRALEGKKSPPSSTEA